MKRPEPAHRAASGLVPGGGALSLDEHQILDLRLILRQLTPGQRTVQLDERPA